MDSMGRGRKMHIVMLPWLGFGHIIPYLDVSKRLAQKGHNISFVSTPRNISRMPKIPQHLASLIDLVGFPLPQVEGLPPDAEASSDIPFEKLPILARAYRGLQESISKFLETNNPDWVVYDVCTSWLPPIAAKLGIRRAFFTTLSTCGLCLYGTSSETMEDLAKWPPPEDLTRPPKWLPFPSKTMFRPSEAAILLQTVVDEDMSPSHTLACIRGCDVILSRSCKEVEAAYLKTLEELHGKPVVPLGLLPPLQESREDDTWKFIKEWLDKHDKRSVIYVAFGSDYLQLTQEGFTELALAFELSGLPFFWVIGFSCDHSFLLPDGFEERTKHQGLVLKTWAPQIKILSHESIGGFLTHCGSSSIIEGLKFGQPLIMLPLLGELPLIAKVLEGKNVGIEVPRDEVDGSFTRESVAKSLKLVMVDEAGKIYRDTAKEMSLIYGDQNLHDCYLDKFEEYISTNL
ncbi:hypothetical protein Nepgr_016516 [Nepenthes gracilis]|uniref:Glycosyltransferase n=1 Tax=Nepenthes gracilis TaxID=150966 RepID=A0AAD3SMV0_NEPGR|nr:hypothetical protein Nepgr_016516 [Nepenthes gracilis]